MASLPGVREQSKSPAGQTGASEERGCPETPGSQVFDAAVDVHSANMHFYLSRPAEIQTHAAAERL